METILGGVGALPLVHGADTEHVTLHMPIGCDEDEDDDDDDEAGQTGGSK